MNVISVIEIIKNKFSQTGSPIKIPKLKGGTFTAELKDDGIEVDNLGNQPFLPWAVFQEAVCVLLRNGGRGLKGNAMGPKLGEPELPFESIEGHIAHVVYGKKNGESVFRRITPISCILIWAGICVSEPNELILTEQTLTKHESYKNTGVLLLWRRGEADSFLEKVDVKIFQDGIVQIENSEKKERITTHVSNIAIVEQRSS